MPDLIVAISNHWPQKTRAAKPEPFKDGRRSEIILLAKIGDGITKRYEGYDVYGSGYMTTAAIEQSIRMAVSEMLKDSEVINYLKN